MAGNRGDEAMERTITPHDSPSAIGALFGLSAEEALLVEDLCSDILAEKGINGRRFFDRMRQGDRFDTALGLSGDLCEALYARAHRWFAVGRPEKAEPLFRALCAADAASADYWCGLGICLRLSDQPDAARLSFETAARLRPDWSVPAFHQCELSILRRDWDEASRHLKTFRAASNEDTPPQMLTESVRFEHVLDFHLRR